MNNQKCSGAHCRCMDIGGQCPNMHWYHCKKHNPKAKPKHGQDTFQTMTTNQDITKLKVKTHCSECGRMLPSEMIKVKLRKMSKKEINDHTAKMREAKRLKRLSTI